MIHTSQKSRQFAICESSSTLLLLVKIFGHASGTRAKIGKSELTSAAPIEAYFADRTKLERNTASCARHRAVQESGKDSSSAVMYMYEII